MLSSGALNPLPRHAGQASRVGVNLLVFKKRLVKVEEAVAASPRALDAAMRLQPKPDEVGGTAGYRGRGVWALVCVRGGGGEGPVRHRQGCVGTSVCWGGGREGAGVPQAGVCGH